MKKCIDKCVQCFWSSFTNFNGVRKADDVHHSSLVDSVGKEEMRVKRQLL